MPGNGKTKPTCSTASVNYRPGAQTASTRATITTRRWPSPATSAHRSKKHVPWKESAAATSKTATIMKASPTCSRRSPSTSTSEPQEPSASSRPSRIITRQQPDPTLHMAGITQLALPDQQLVDAYKAGFAYTQIDRSGNALDTGTNGYHAEYEHDVIGILANM